MNSDLDDIVKPSELARRLGLSKGRISQMKAEGMPVREDGLVRISEAVAWIDENVEPSRRKLRTSPLISDTGRPVEYARVRAEHERLKLERTAHALDVERRELIRKGDVQDAIFARARMEREAHENFVVRAAPLLAAEFSVDEGDMLHALDREMRRHLEDLARLPLNLFEDDDDADRPMGE